MHLNQEPSVTYDLVKVEQDSTRLGALQSNWLTWI